MRSSAQSGKAVEDLVDDPFEFLAPHARSLAGRGGLD
jgi:hypothetical protein